MKGMVELEEIDRWLSRTLYVCSFCKGYGRHTCTGITCSEAVQEAEKYYKQSKEGKRVEKCEKSTIKNFYGWTVMEALHEVLQVDKAPALMQPKVVTSPRKCRVRIED